MRNGIMRRVAGWLALLAIAGAARAQTDGAQRWPAPFSTLSTATQGNIVASPAVGPDGTVYIGVEVGARGSATTSGKLFAIGPNGVQKWEFATPDWVESTPAIGPDGVIYFGCWNGALYALNPDGTKRWEYKAGSFIASSPALAADGTIYVGAGNNLVAVNPDGTLKWLFPSGDWIDAAPAVAPDGTIYVGSWDKNFYAISPAGTEKWRFLTNGNVAGSPAIAADGTIYVGSRDAKFRALRPDGTLKWLYDALDNVESSPALGADGSIYITTFGGRLIALNVDGTERWRYPRAGQTALTPIYSSPAVRADGSIVFGTSSNAIYALRSDGTQLWRTPMGDWSDSSAVVAADGSIYIGCADKKLYAFTGTVEPLATDWPQFRRDPRRTGWQPIGTVAGTIGRMSNLSVRTLAGSGADTLIVGFVVGGAGSRSLLLRGVGPTLANFGVTGLLANPRIVAYAGQTEIASNDDWGLAPNAGAITTTAAAVGAFPLPTGSLDAVWLGGLAASAYTVHVTGAGGATGEALMEVYDAGGAIGARLINVSARSTVGGTAGVLIAGFVIGENSRSILVRATGPALAAFGMSGTLANPRLRVFKGSQLVAENNDWSTGIDMSAIAAAAARVGAFALPPGGSQDAAMLLTLPPGAYTAQVSGLSGGSGIALVEVYEVP